MGCSECCHRGLMMAQAYFGSQKNSTMIMMLGTGMVHLEIRLGHSSVQYQDLL